MEKDPLQFNSNTTPRSNRASSLLASLTEGTPEPIIEDERKEESLPHPTNPIGSSNHSSDRASDLLASLTNGISIGDENDNFDDVDNNDDDDKEPFADYQNMPSSPPPLPPPSPPPQPEDDVKEVDVNPLSQTTTPTSASKANAQELFGNSLFGDNDYEDVNQHTSVKKSSLFGDDNNDSVTQDNKNNKSASKKNPLFGDYESDESVIEDVNNSISSNKISLFGETDVQDSFISSSDEKNATSDSLFGDNDDIKSEDPMLHPPKTSLDSLLAMNASVEETPSTSFKSQSSNPLVGELNDHSNENETRNEDILSSSPANKSTVVENEEIPIHQDLNANSVLSSSESHEYDENNNRIVPPLVKHYNALHQPKPVVLISSPGSPRKLPSKKLEAEDVEKAVEDFVDEDDVIDVDDDEGDDDDSLENGLLSKLPVPKVEPDEIISPLKEETIVTSVADKRELFSSPLDENVPESPLPFRSPGGLASSGLLGPSRESDFAATSPSDLFGDSGGGEGEGLFDDLDAEEERQRLAEEKRRREILEAAKRRKEEEERRKEQEHIYLEQKRKKEEEQRKKQERIKLEQMRRQEEQRKEQERIELEQLRKQEEKRKEQERIYLEQRRKQEEQRKEKERIHLEQNQRKEEQARLLADTENRNKKYSDPLFGGDEIISAPSNRDDFGHNVNESILQPLPPPSSRMNSLAQSGLLSPLHVPNVTLTSSSDMFSDSAGSGGLFDDLDAEEERQRLAEEKRQREILEAAKRRKEEEERRKEQERIYLEQKRKKEEEAKRLAELQAKAEAVGRERAQTEARERAQIDARAAAKIASTTANYYDNGNTRNPMQSETSTSAPPSSFYRPHKPDIIMDDPLRSYNMTGRYDGQSSHTASNLQAQTTNSMKSPSRAPQRYVSPNNNNSYQEFRQTNSPYRKQPQTQTPSPLAGIYNSPPSQNISAKPTMTLFSTPSPDFDPVFGEIMVNDPRMMTTPGLFGTPPHWTYSVTTLPKQGHPGSVIVVRRRFKHFVALEERLREACPGSILPPRPDKHEARLIEEGLQQQSPAFAAARAIELQTYLNNLAQHPHAGKSEPLRLFLTLYDHMGAAWPEVSTNALTRLGRVSTNAAVKVAESTNNALTLNQHVAEMGEDNAELLALATSEHVRLTALMQSVVKIEGFIHQTREYGERNMFTGLETSRLCNAHLSQHHQDLSVPLSLLATGMMKSGKCTKYLSLQLSAAFGPFVMEYRQSKNERMAFQDRRIMLLKRESARSKAAEKSAKLLMHQRQLQINGNMGMLERMEYEASNTDEAFTEVAKETEEVGKILAGEVTRLAMKRRKEWMDSLKVMASGFKEASAEKTAIWVSLKADMEDIFPGSGSGDNFQTRIDNNATMTTIPESNASNATNLGTHSESPLENGGTVVAIPGAKTMTR